MIRLLLALAFIVPTPALAHAPIPGIKGFYIGLIHPFSTPAQVLALLAVGLMMGGFRPEQYRLAGVMVLVGGFAGLFFGVPTHDYTPYLLVVAIVAAFMAALVPGKGLFLAVPCIFAASILIGMIGVPDPGPQRERLITMAGTYIGLNVIMLYAAGLNWVARDKIRGAWLPIGLRIAAAWIAAIASILLALQFAVAEV